MAHTLKTTAALLTALLFATLTTSCGGKDSHEKVMDDSLELMDQFVTILGEVKDKESGDAAAKKLEKLQGKFDKLAARAEALGTPDPEVMKELEKKFEKRGEELTQKMTGIMVKSMTTGSEELQKAMQNIGKAMEKVK